MKYWVQYLRDKRVAFILYISTVMLFLVTGGLYHVENFKKLIYATLLTSALWTVVEIIQGMRYTEQCKRLDETIQALEQYQDTELLELLNRMEFIRAGENSADGVSKRLNQMLLLAGETMERAHLEQERKDADRKDYYLMWTHQIKTPIFWCERAKRSISLAEIRDIRFRPICRIMLVIVMSGIWAFMWTTRIMR